MIQVWMLLERVSIAERRGLIPLARPWEWVWGGWLMGLVVVEEVFLVGVGTSRGLEVVDVVEVGHGDVDQV